MSAQVQRVTRRDLRRAMGSGAVTVIETQRDQIEALTRTIREHDARIASVNRELDARTTQQALVAQERHDAFVNRSFWERWRWLVTGR